MIYIQFESVDFIFILIILYYTESYYIIYIRLYIIFYYIYIIITKIILVYFYIVVCIRSCFFFYSLLELTLGQFRSAVFCLLSTVLYAVQFLTCFWIVTRCA